MRTLVDSSTIIALAEIGELDLLRELLGRVFVTREVLAGCGALDSFGEDLPSWIQISDSHGKTATVTGLGAGETSLLAACAEGDRLVLDDLPARKVAASRAIPTTGLLGLLLAGARGNKLAKERALRILDDLSSSGFHVSPSLYTGTRQAIEES